MLLLLLFPFFLHIRLAFSFCYSFLDHYLTKKKENSCYQLIPSYDSKRLLHVILLFFVKIQDISLLLLLRGGDEKISHLLKWGFYFYTRMQKTKKKKFTFATWIIILLCSMLILSVWLAVITKLHSLIRIFPTNKFLFCNVFTIYSTGY